MDPYLVLGVSRHSDDLAIRAAYLDAVRRFPPEKDPHRFAEIQQARELLKDRRARVRYEHFNTDMPAKDPLDALRQVLRHGGTRTPPSYRELKEMLRRCATMG